MKVDYLLVDYENVQPRSLRELDGQPVHVMVFVGPNQARLPVEFAASLQALGTSAEYVQVNASGRNALDFHIAYTLGELSAKVPGAGFQIISKDTGFDPLLAYLRSRGIRAQRCGAIIDRAGVAEKLARIVDNLKSRGNSRPRKRSTLASSINSLFQKTLEPCEVDGLIKALQKERYITLEGEAVTYDFSRT
jgi:hypothetical protein